jgi:vancomycin permeability regulator SanA
MEIFDKIPRKKKNFWGVIKKLISFSLISVILITGSASLFVWSNYKQNFAGNKDCAVVFGAAVWRDDIPSHALFDRTIAGINLYKNKHVSCLIFSGGKSKYGTHEAKVMKKIALKNKIPAKNIFLDYEGNSTIETVRNVRKNFAEKSLVFVSNDFHLARIKLLANRLGIKDFAVHAAKYNKGRYFKDSYFFFREILGVSFYAIFLW